MEKVIISKKEYEELLAELNKLRKEKEESLPDVEEQLEMGLEDLRKGRIVDLN